MKISIGSDHRGLHQRKIIGESIVACSHEVNDLGTMTEESCDYPDIAKLVAKSVASGEAQMGILVCGTGIGMSIAANKVCLLYTSPSPRDGLLSRMPSSA